MMEALYPTLVWFHVLLLVFWLGADLGVFLLGQHFRKREVYSVPERLVLLKLLVITDMGPRTAWALMLPSSLLLLKLGGWWPGMPAWLVVSGVVVGLGWLGLVWFAHLNDQTPRAKAARAIENPLKFLIMGFYLTLGAVSLLQGSPLAGFVAWKALLFGLIFAAAIMIDIAFKPVGPQLMALIEQGSSDGTELPLRATMDRTRLWVQLTYVLLFATSWLGVTKGVPLL
jgi:hypothetical protein